MIAEIGHFALILALALAVLLSVLPLVGHELTVKMKSCSTNWLS